MSFVTILEKRLSILMACAVLASALGAGTACATPKPLAKPASTAQKPAVRPSAPAIPAGFDAWQVEFKRRARRAGIQAQTVERALEGVAPDPKVLERDAYQPEFVRPIWDYLDGAVSSTRVKNGRSRLARHRTILAAIEKEYGVPAKVIVAIWGLETSYGALKGKYDVIQSLATLAFTGRRKAFGERELINALKIVQAGDKEPRGLKGSWAGAMGHTQFLPSSFLSYAVDHDGDGRRDIWDSLPDAFASTANFLKNAKWDPEYRWGREVRLPDGFDFALADRKKRRSLARWAKLGVRRADGGPLPAADIKAAILVPAGHRGPAFMVYDNFNALMRYNPATAYALGVAILSDRIAGAGTIQGSWPRDLKILSRDQREALQTGLNAAGYSVGEVDGVLGARTRAAIRKFQSDRGLKADGFATLDLLEAVRQVNP